MTPDAKYVTLTTSDNGIIQFINNSTDITNLLNNDISLNGNLKISGISTLNGRLITTSDTSLNKNLYVGLDTSLNKNLYVSGTSNLNGKVIASSDTSLNNNLYVQLDTSLNSNLYVSGTSTLNGKLITNSDTSLNRNLYVQADTSLNRNLYVSGTSTFNGRLIGSDISANRNLYVGGDVSLNSNLFVGGSIINTGLTSTLASKANLASPTFTGVPTAPTASSGTNTTQIATTAFVIEEITSRGSQGSQSSQWSISGDTVSLVAGTRVLTPVFGSGNYGYRTVVMSSTGQYMLFAYYFGHNYISTSFSSNYGETITNLSLPAAVGEPNYAFSTTGQYQLIGSSSSPTRLLLSSNYGSSFSVVREDASYNSGLAVFNKMAISSTGQYIITFGVYKTGSDSFLDVHYSTNYGVSFTKVSNVFTQVGGDLYVYGTCMSADGSTIYIAMFQKIYKSTDYGASWTLNVTNTNITNQGFISMKISSDGQYIVYNSMSVMFVSSNYGSSWTLDTTWPGAVIQYIVGFDMTPDGKYRTFTTGTNTSTNAANRVYESFDYGSTWTFENILVGSSRPGGAPSITISSNYANNPNDSYRWIGVLDNVSSNIYTQADNTIFAYKQIKTISKLYIPNDVSLNGNLNVSGTSTLNGRLITSSDTSLNRNLYVGSDTSLNRNLYVSGTSTFNGRITGSDISVNTSLSVPIINNVSQINGSNIQIGNTSSIIHIGNSSSTVYIDGSLNYITTDNLQVKDSMITLNKNGISSNNSGIEIEKNGSINASIKLTDNNGWVLDTSLNQNSLYVVGKSSFNNQVNINNNLYVQSDTSLNNNLYVLGTINKIKINNDNSNNISIGNNNLNNTSGYSNISIGNNNLTNNTSGILNLALGFNSLQNNTSGTGNMAFGYETLKNNLSGYSNIAIGRNALLSITNGWNNVSIGPSSLQMKRDGYGNTALGHSSGLNDISGNLNTFIGMYSDISSNSTITNSTALGYNAKITNSNQIMLGTASETVVIPGTSTLNGKLIAGSDVSLNKNLYVQADTSLNGNLYVAGTLTFNSLTLNNKLTSSDISVNKNLYVQLDTSLNRNLYVGGSIINTGLTSALVSKAPLESPTLTGIPTAPTAALNTNTTQLATTAFVATEIAALVNSAPSTLNTLNELATALGNDAAFSTSITNSLATKAPLASPTFTGTVTIPTGASITAPTGLVKGDVGLGSVDNTSDANKPVSTATTTALALKANLDAPSFTGIVVSAGDVSFNNNLNVRGSIVNSELTTALASKAPLESPTLTGIPTAPTAAATTSTTQIATTAFVVGEINALINSAPGALNTLNELATALGNDAAFSTTVTNSLAAKAPLASPTFTGILTCNGNCLLNQTNTTTSMDTAQIGYTFENTTRSSNNADTQVTNNSTKNILSFTPPKGVWQVNINWQLTALTSSGAGVVSGMTIVLSTTTESLTSYRTFHCQREMDDSVGGSGGVRDRNTLAGVINTTGSTIYYINANIKFSTTGSCYLAIPMLTYTRIG